MIKHIMMWRLKDSAGGRSKNENAIMIKERLEAKVGVVPGLLKAEVGIDIGPTPQFPWRGEDASDVVFYSEWESRAALNNYMNNPDNHFVREVRTERRVVDFEI
jgi:quinol monooxygenase YgiN